ncbi:MAG: hypothetical protein ACM3WU_05445 [Bacillota bacterium]
MTVEEADIRVRNPFQDLLVTELIEDPERYSQMFSSKVLVGETLAVFRASNTVLTGPQGAGKSMILNLVRYRVMGEYEQPHADLIGIPPWLGISVNLTRIGFHAFGLRSVSRYMSASRMVDHYVDTICACDYLSHYLFREFVQSLVYISTHPRFSDWLRVSVPLDERALVERMRTWRCWSGYYKDCTSFQELIERCDKRLHVWRSFLNSNFDVIPEDVWGTKTDIQDCMHSMGNMAASLSRSSPPLPLFVVVDQYEELTQLNLTHGSYLQRAINTLLKARDPKVFYKIGVRTHDWGKELRVLGGDSIIEEQRDYVRVNLSEVLMRKENPSGWVFEKLAKDVAQRRLLCEGYKDVGSIEQMLGKYDPRHEAALYFRNDRRVLNVTKGLPEPLRQELSERLGPSPNPLDARLAAAWVYQRMNRRESVEHIVADLDDRPWDRTYWRKERTTGALLQLASLDNQRKYYFGWHTVLYLSGGNISAFLLICSSIWDEAAKMGEQPDGHLTPLSPAVQTRGIYAASETWAARDNGQPGGRLRHEFLRRLGEAIHRATIDNLALSNPGHSGFSLSEAELNSSPKGERVREFLGQCVNWAMLEERRHTSKNRRDSRRRKWYLHPLLSPVYGIPHIRVKEPYYAHVDEVSEWILPSPQPIKFGSGRRKPRPSRPNQSLQRPLPWG